MKKISCLILVFFIFNVSCFSASVSYLAPFLGGKGVNLLSTAYDGGENGWQDNGNNPHAGEGVYSNVEIIAIGGTSGQFNGSSAMPSAENPLILTVTSATDMMFVSQSNPAYKVPFELQVIARTKINNTSQNLGEPYDLGSGKQEVPLYLPQGGSGLWFDILLVLPARQLDGNQNLLVDGKGRIFSIDERNDYAAMIDLSLSWDDPNTAGKDVDVSLSIPFTGYIDFSEGSSSNYNPSEISVYVQELPKARNINLQTEYGSWLSVASVEATSTGTTAAGSAVTASGYQLFLSASGDANYADQNGFRLVNDNAKGSVNLAVNQYVSYKARLFDALKNTYKEYDGKGNAVNVNCVIPSKNTYNAGEREDVYSYDFSGTVDIFIDNMPASIMESGSYSSTIYLHVLKYEGVIQ